VRDLRWATFLVVVASAHAWAQTPTSLPQAEALFARGEQYSRAEAWALALADFQGVQAYLDSVQHPRRWAGLYNIGVCFEELGHYNEALASYERFLREAPPNAPQRPEVERLTRELRLRIGSGFAPSPIGMIIAGSGLAIAIAGAILGGVALAGRGEIASMCTADGYCPDTLLPRANEVSIMAGVADGLLFGGLGVAAVGAVLTFVLTDGRAPPLTAGLWIDSQRAMLVLGGVL
jgi:tetratricopeptide (TPR) repeat protein